MSSLPPPRKSDLAGLRVLVLGLGRSGTSIASYLLRQGGRVLAWDENKPVPPGLRARGLRRCTDPGRARADWAIASPGIPDEHPALRAVAARGIPVIDELDLSAALLGGTLVAITGTNGKSTTTALTAELLRNAGRRVFAGGNLAPGRPLAAALGLPRQDVYVAEASSFQLSRCRWLQPRVAIILNITPDHLARHGGLGAYARAKLRILARQQPGDFAVLNHDDALLRRVRGQGRASRRWFSVHRPVAGAYLAGGWLCLDGRRVLGERRLRIPGRHNVANALAALAAASCLGVDAAASRRALRAFAGLPHRLELVRTFEGVDYINNSMCTNPAAGVESLAAIAAGPARRRVILIAGGRSKSLPMQPYLRAIARQARWTVLTGESREEMARSLRARGYARASVVVDLKIAVSAARTRARAGDVVLFSPGFASFDQYADFRARGEAFRREVNRLG
jgi:UDP-N-acetylmuramoylalanine--D-glutamate ligase